MTENQQTLQIISGISGELSKQPDVFMGFSLTNQDLEAMLADGISLAKNKVKGIAVDPQLNVQIEADEIRVRGSVGVDYPMMGHSSVNVESVVISNTEPKGGLWVKEAKFSKHLSPQVQVAAAVGNVDIDNEIGSRLKDPYKSLYETIGKEMWQQGVQLGQLTFNIEDGQVVIGISGRPIPPQGR